MHQEFAFHRWVIYPPLCTRAPPPTVRDEPLYPVAPAPAFLGSPLSRATA